MGGRGSYHRIMLVLVLASAAVGCNRGNPAPAACAPGEAPWPEAFDLSGQYSVMMTTRTGQDSGVTISGSMVLHPMEVSGNEARSGYHVEYAGSAQIALADVGAYEVGSIGSEDPAQPGVIVQIDRSGERVNVLVRLGSEANRTDRTRFDGAYTVFRVSGMTDNSFSGTWMSGISTTEASGQFCAIKS